VLPVATVIALGGSVILQKREAQQPALDDPVLVREIQQLRQQAQILVQGAAKVRMEAARLLVDAPDLDLLVTVQEVCDQAHTLPQALEERVQRLSQTEEAVLAVATLAKQLAQVRRQKRRVGHPVGLVGGQFGAQYPTGAGRARYPLGSGDDTRHAGAGLGGGVATIAKPTAGV
jgi:riboflavin biosynthesis pyrimidine reductase